MLAYPCPDYHGAAASTRAIEHRWDLRCTRVHLNCFDLLRRDAVNIEQRRLPGSRVVDQCAIDVDIHVTGKLCTSQDVIPIENVLEVLTLECTLVTATAAPVRCPRFRVAADSYRDTRHHSKHVAGSPVLELGDLRSIKKPANAQPTSFVKTDELGWDVLILLALDPDLGEGRCLAFEDKVAEDCKASFKSEVDSIWQKADSAHNYWMDPWGHAAESRTPGAV